MTKDLYQKAEEMAKEIIARAKKEADEFSNEYKKSMKLHNCHISNLELLNTRNAYLSGYLSGEIGFLCGKLVKLQESYQENK